jgi:hypothetical protein
MSPPLPITRKLIRGGRAKALLALACLAVLALGALVAPPRNPPPAARAETVAPILEAQVERRSSARVFRGVQDAGSKALRYSVTFPAPARSAGALTHPDFSAPFRDTPLPSGFGVLVSPREVLTHVAAVEARAEPEAQAADGMLLPCRAVAYEPETGLMLLELAAPAPSEPPTPAAEPPAPGELAVAAARLEGRDFVAPVFIAATEPERYLISAASGVTFPGTPVYTLDGRPLAVVAGRGALPIAYPVGPSVERLRRRIAERRAFPSSIGVRLQALEGGLSARLGPGAALLSDVLPGGPAEQVGLRAGDVLLRVAGAEPRGLEDALSRLARLPAGVDATLLIRRDGRQREHAVAPVAALQYLQDASRPPPVHAPEARSVFREEDLRAAGVPSEAALLAVEGRSVASPEAAAMLLRRRPAPWLAYLQEGSHRFYAAIGSAS